MPNITVYTLTYNEELRAQFMIDHYRSRFPNCHIVFYDNSSTDKTLEIAKNNNCEVINYNSNHTLDDGLHMRMKNSIWKSANTDWVLVCDLDELLDINEEQLLAEELAGNTKIKSEGYSMVNMEDNYDLHSMKYGYRDGGYDKDVLFNKKFISETNYGPGCHSSNFVGHIKYSQPYKLYHYKAVNVEETIARCADTAKRLSQTNRANGWGGAALRTEKAIRDDYVFIRSVSFKVRD